MLVYTELTSIFSYIDVRSKIVKYAGTFINLNNKEKLLLNDRTRDRDTLENKCSSIILLSILLKLPIYFSKLIFYDKSQLIFNESQFLWFMTSVSCVFMETFHTTISFAFLTALTDEKQNIMATQQHRSCFDISNELFVAVEMCGEPRKNHTKQTVYKA